MPEAPLPFYRFEILLRLLLQPGVRLRFATGAFRVPASMRSRLWQPNVPFSPARLPVFYGWVILVVSSVGIVMSIPGQTMGVSVFTDVLIAKLGLSRMELSVSYLIGTAASGFMLPWGGGLLDRWGARASATVVALLFGVMVLLMSQCDRLGAGPWFLAFGGIAAAFFGLRFLGQGMLTVVSRAVLGKWFDRRRGFVFAVSGVLVTFSFAAAPRFLNDLIEWAGWRGAYVALGLIVLIGMSLVAWLFYRDNPEECGLEMDGGAGSAQSKRNPDLFIAREMTRGEAARTFAFWAANLTIAWQALLVTAYTFHVVSIGAESGLDKPTILGFFMEMAVVGVASNFLSGWMADRTRANYVLVLLAVGMTGAGCGLLRLGEPVGHWIFVVGVGLASGTFQTATGLIWPRYFGRLHVGAVSGLNMSTIVLASALGPVLFSISHDFAGSYRPAFWMCVFVPVLLGIASVFATNPQLRFAGENPSR